MTAVFYCILLIFVMGFQQINGQSPPRIPEAFYSEYMLIQEGTVVKAIAYHDLAAGKDRTVHMMGADKGQVNFLIRLDLQTAYQYYEPYDYCSITERGNITIPNFDWVQYSRYKESIDFYGQNVDIWIYQDTSLYNEIGVSASNKNIPVFYFRSNGREESFALTIFNLFTPGPPDDSKFDVPHSCSVPSVLDQSGMKGSLMNGLRNGGNSNIEKVRSAMFRKVDALMKQVDE